MLAERDASTTGPRIIGAHIFAFLSLHGNFFLPFCVRVSTNPGVKNRNGLNSKFKISRATRPFFIT